MEGRLELASHKVALAENIVVLEELDHSNAVLLYHVFNLRHQGLVLLFASKIEVPIHVRRLGAGGWSVDSLVEVVAVTEELGIFDLQVLVSVDEGKQVDLLIADREPEVGKDLSEDLLRDLEVLMAVVVLEEGLGVKSVPPGEFGEVEHDLLNLRLIVFICLWSVIVSRGVDIINVAVDVLLEALLGEDFVHCIAEVPPADVLASLVGLEFLAEVLELLLRDLDLGHAEANSELAGGDEAGSELVEVAEGLVDPNPLLGGGLSNSGKDVVDVAGGITDDLSVGGSGGSLGEVVI